MSYRSKVVWSEGLFLRPQHFQQHDRYLERYLHLRSVAMRAHSWGFSELRLDRDLLRLGKVAISSAQGVFPDGTPFSMPDDDQVPAPIEIDEKVRDQIIFLCQVFKVCFELFKVSSVRYNCMPRIPLLELEIIQKRLFIVHQKCRESVCLNRKNIKVLQCNQEMEGMLCVIRPDPVISECTWHAFLPGVFLRKV